MANRIEAKTPGANGSAINAAWLLRTDQYGAGALIRFQWSATATGVYADITGTATVPLESGIETYPIGDTVGTSSMYYRSRFENSGGSRVSDWSPATVTRYE